MSGISCAGCGFDGPLVDVLEHQRTCSKNLSFVRVISDAGFDRAITLTDIDFSCTSTCPLGHIAVHFLEPSVDDHVMRTCIVCESRWMERG
jgi:hypothetical protein